jgi:hypothetical protein
MLWIMQECTLPNSITWKESLAVPSSICGEVLRRKSFPTTLDPYLPLDSKLIYETISPGQYWIVAPTLCQMPILLRTHFHSARHSSCESTQCLSTYCPDVSFSYPSGRTDSIAHIKPVCGPSASISIAWTLDWLDVVHSWLELPTLVPPQVFF